MENRIVTTKRCTRCRINFPATREYFGYLGHKKDKLHYQCNDCLTQIEKRKVIVKKPKIQHGDFINWNDDAIYC